MLNLQIFIFSLVILLGLALKIFLQKKRRKLVRRLRDFLGGDETPDFETWRYFFKEKTVALGRYIFLHRIFSKKDATSIVDLINSAGLKPDAWLHFMIGSKVILIGLFFFIGSATGFYLEKNEASILIIGIITALIGGSLPEWILKVFVSRYRKALDAGLSDMLDLMVICAEAGLTFETIFERTALEIKFSSPPVARELDKLRSDLKILGDPVLALNNFGRVPDMEPLRRLAITLMQSMKFGTPLGETLRVLSAELRRERILAAEEKAGRLPALLTIPMVLFILPSIFCMLLGPAVIQLMRDLS